ncbi:MAG: hypothetical protein JST91_31310 [Actinobacteria bacterium]|nr:hypothetical protein [Actinomycetota bacterium]
MPDRRKYDASRFDLPALQALARRAAQETPATKNAPVQYRDGDRVVEAVGVHWLLDARRHNIRRMYSGTGYQTEEETREDHLYVLLPDGSLKQVVVTTEDTTVLDAGGAFRSHRSSKEHHDYEFDASQAEMFDFERKYVSFPESWGDRSCGDELLVDAKGAGLTEVLSDLAAGRRASQPSPIAPLPPAPASRPQPAATARTSGCGSSVDTFPDHFAVGIAVVAALTVLVPFLLGHFLMTRTFVLAPDPDVYFEEVRGIWDHFLATYLAGLIPITALLGAFLVLRRPWAGRTSSVVIGGLALISTVALFLPITQSEWHDAEHKTVAKLRETAFPYADKYVDCASWTINAENGAHDPELWQVHLGLAKGTSVDGCNLAAVYRGWTFVGNFTLPDVDVFTGDIEVNHVGWDEPYRNSGGGDISQISRKTGAPLPMNPKATNVILPTSSGQVLDFNLDGAGTGQFTLR